MNNIENIILEFVRYIDPGTYIIIAMVLLWFPLLVIPTIVYGYKKSTDKEEKKSHIRFLIFLLVIYIIGDVIFLKPYFSIKNKTMADLNNENKIILQEKNNNIEIYYISKEYKSEIDENILEKSDLKITVQQTEDEKYYIYFGKNINNKKEVKKEDLKDFVQNIKKQENYIDINKIKKFTLKDLE